MTKTAAATATTTTTSNNSSDRDDNLGKQQQQRQQPFPFLYLRLLHDRSEVPPSPELREAAQLPVLVVGGEAVVATPLEVQGDQVQAVALVRSLVFLKKK